MPTYRVKYKNEIHDIDWTGAGKPSKDELRLAISNKILQKEAPSKLDTTYKPKPLAKPDDPFVNKYGQKVDEFGLPELYGYGTEKFLSKPLAPDIESEPDTYLGGFTKSLYKDFVQPLTTPRSIAQIVLTGKSATKLANRTASTLPELPELATATKPHYTASEVADYLRRKQSSLPDLPDVANEIKGSTLPDLPMQSAADVGLPNLRGTSLNTSVLPQPGASVGGQQNTPSLWSNIMNLTKSAKTTLDLSAPLRQGLPRIHTKEYWGAIKPMFKSLMSEEGYQNVLTELQNKPSLPVARHAGLAIFEREEQIASNLAEKIPGLGNLAKASNRAYDAFIKKLRMDTFENLINDAVKSGADINPKFTQNLAEVINTATGRGTLGNLERHAGLLNNVFFSPKFISSRVQMFNPQYYMKLDSITRKEAIKSTLALTTFGTTLGGLAKLAGADVEGDSTSSDYGKIKIGDYRIDPFAGMQQYVVLLSKIAQQQQKSPITGNVRKFDAKYGSPTALGAVARFGQNKLNPLLGLGAKLLEGTDFAGQPLDKKKEVLKSFIPMLAEDTYEVITEDPSMIPLMVPSAFGMGVQRFTPRETDSNERPSRQGRKERKRRK